jgi:hypothetical protein
MTEMTTRYLITNRNPQPLTVIVEHWAEEVVLSPKSSLSITVLHDREGVLEIETDPKYLTALLWGGCRAKLAVDGKELAMPWLLDHFLDLDRPAKLISPAIMTWA